MSTALHKSVSNRIIEYDILRTILTLLVVIGHLSYYGHLTNWGGVDYSILIHKNGFRDSHIHQFIVIICYCIYTFHMPAFMMLSGALHRVTSERDCKLNYGRFVIKRFKKLIVPYLVVTLLYVVPLKYYVGYWINSKSIINDIFFGQVLLMGNNHLWFLPTLFILELIFNIEQRTNLKITKKDNKFSLLLFLFAISCVSDIFIKQIFLMSIAKYGFWFYFGFFVEDYRCRICQKISNQKFIFASFSWIISCGFIKICDYYGIFGAMIKPIVKQFSGIIGCVMVLYLSYLVSDYFDNHFSNRKNVILENSLPIFLYGDIFNYLVLYWFYNIFGLNGFTSELYSFSLIILRFSISLFGALAVSMILKKMHFKYIV